MSKQKLKLEVEGLKIEPLKFYMDKQGINLEDEIIKAMDEMYEKYVPIQTREYINFQLKDETQEFVQEPVEIGLRPSKDCGGSRSKRNHSKQKAPRTKETVQVETNDQGIVSEAGMQEELVQSM